MTEGENLDAALPVFPSRRSYPAGPFGTSSFVEACGAYTAQLAKRTYEIQRAMLAEIQAMRRTLEAATKPE